jgi:hypothetical protein
VCAGAKPVAAPRALHVNQNNERVTMECVFCVGRSANFNNASGECALSDMDRITLSGTGAFQRAGAAANGKKRQADAGAAVDDVVVDMDYDYLENNCVDEPSKMCDFRRVCGFRFVFSRVERRGACRRCRQGARNWCNLGGDRCFR